MTAAHGEDGRERGRAGARERQDDQVGAEPVVRLRQHVLEDLGGAVAARRAVALAEAKQGAMADVFDVKNIVNAMAGLLATGGSSLGRPSAAIPRN